MRTYHTIIPHNHHIQTCRQTDASNTHTHTHTHRYTQIHSDTETDKAQEGNRSITNTKQRTRGGGEHTKRHAASLCFETNAG